MREAVRSGRRTNFFITENRFIDHYASKVGGNGVAVYSILQRCANSETRETWISAGKMADVLAMDKSTVYRYLKQLEDLRLIKSMRTREKTIYVVLPVPPPRPEAGSTPLFDAVDVGSESKSARQESSWDPAVSVQMSPVAETDSFERDSPFAQPPQIFAATRPGRRVGENRNKEEQEFLNKTQEQDFYEQENGSETVRAARSVLAGLGLSDQFLKAAAAAVEAQMKLTRQSTHGVVNDILTAANQAARRGIQPPIFLEDFLAQKSARGVLASLNLPVTNNLAFIVAAALKAEVSRTGLPFEKAADFIVDAAEKDEARGTAIDRFYFENTKWRTSNARSSKAEQRKLDNLEVNARVKQRLRERLGAS